MPPISWLDGSTGSIAGWTLFHSLWQGMFVAGGLALVLRFVPDRMVRLRTGAAWGALLLLVVLTAGSWVLVETEWRGHVACWSSTDYARRNPELCAAHAVPAAHAQLEAEGKPHAPMPLSWLRRLALPVPERVQTLSLVATGAVRLLALGWAAVALVALLHLAVGLRLLRTVLSRARPVRDGDLDGLLRRLRAELGVAVPVSVRESPDVSTPAVAGWRRPVVLLPPGMKDTLRGDQLTDVLAHEMVHVRERHFVVNLAQRVLDCVCLLNPGALWISSRIREEREVHCDRVAAGAPAPGRGQYARTLLELEQIRASSSGPALVGLLGEGSLLRRIRRLADPGASGGRGRALAAVAGSAATLLLVVQLSMSFVALTSWAVMSYDIARREAAPAAQAAAASSFSPLR